MDRFYELARSCCKLALVRFGAVRHKVFAMALNTGQPNMTKRAWTDPGLGWDALPI